MSSGALCRSPARHRSVTNASSNPLPPIVSAVASYGCTCAVASPAAAIAVAHRKKNGSRFSYIGDVQTDSRTCLKQINTLPVIAHVDRHDLPITDHQFQRDPIREIQWK